MTVPVRSFSLSVKKPAGGSGAAGVTVNLLEVASKLSRTGNNLVSWVSRILVVFNDVESTGPPKVTSIALEGSTRPSRSAVNWTPKT